MFSLNLSDLDIGELGIGGIRTPEQMRVGSSTSATKSIDMPRGIAGFSLGSNAKNSFSTGGEFSGGLGGIIEPGVGLMDYDMDFDMYKRC